MKRREFLGAAGMLAAGAMPRTSPARAIAPTVGDTHRGECVIASMNGLRATVRAMELLREGYDPADAIVQGVRIIEDDPEDDSVGYGGLPNYDGVVELDASVMHGPTHKSGAVASIRNIKNPAHVALLVLRRTDHCLLVGEGALRFAVMHGFAEENLLTERSRRQWLAWRENMSRGDDYLDDEERDAPAGRTWDRLPDGDAAPAAHAADRRAWREREVTGTVHCSAVTGAGDVASCTSTSGLNWKLPGRVGDSPIIGAGNYCDNAVGAGGATGRGEACITNLAAYSVVRHMEDGKTPTEACLAVATRIADRTKEKRLLDGTGRPNFDVKLYAVRKDGAYGSAGLYKGASFAVHDGTEAKAVTGAYLFER